MAEFFRFITEQTFPNQPQDSVPVTLEIVGVDVQAGLPFEAPPVDADEGAGRFTVTPAFAELHRVEVDDPFSVPLEVLEGVITRDERVAVLLEPGASRAEVEKAIRTIPGGADVGIVFSTAHAEAATGQMRQQGLALLGIGLMIGLVLLLLTGHAMGREITMATPENAALRALGMSRPALFWKPMTRVVLLSAAAVAPAVGLAILASGLLPLGDAGAVAAAGLRVDIRAIGLGAGVLVVVPFVLTAWPAWRAGLPRVPERTGPPAWPGEVAARSGLPVATVTGVRLGSEAGRGRTAVPVRATVAAVALGLAVSVAAIVVAGSIHHARTTPEAIGWNWDVETGFGFFDDQFDDLAPVMGDARIEAWSAGLANDVIINGRRVGALALNSYEGTIDPVLTDGRGPRGDDELVLGSKTAAGLGVEVGDRVEVGAPATDAGVEMEVVGIGVVRGGGDEGLGHGAHMTLDAWVAAGGERIHRYFAARFRDGLEPLATSQMMVAEGKVLFFDLPEPPGSLGSFGGVSGLPAALGVIIGLVAATVLIHALLATARRRARDFAIFKVLGFRSRQIVVMSIWQATTIVLAGLVVAVPVGIAAGRMAWAAIADRSGVLVLHALPWPLLLVPPVALLLGVVIAVVPGVVAARTRAALVLRTE